MMIVTNGSGFCASAVLDFFDRGALFGTEDAIDLEPAIELWSDPQITMLVERVVPLFDPLSIRDREPVFDGEFELSCRQITFMFMILTNLTRPIAACGLIKRAEHFGERHTTMCFKTRGAARERDPSFRGRMSVLGVQAVTVNRVHDRDLQCIKFAAGSLQHSSQQRGVWGGQELVIGSEQFVQCFIQHGRRFHRRIIPDRTSVCCP